MALCTEQPLGECLGYEAELHSPWGLQEVTVCLCPLVPLCRARGWVVFSTVQLSATVPHPHPPEH